MIRRDVRLADGAAGWMLISQIEHARISAELASKCMGRFGVSPERGWSSSTPAAVRDDVLAAILHHDDGWAEWERAPQLDRVTGRPLTFTELPPADALTIWSQSIDAAAAIGPLAAWMVAGHFLRLAVNSDTMQADGAFLEWRDAMASRRAAWLAAWRQDDPAARTPALAEEALQWLWTFDEVSLWFCCTCSPAEHAIPCAPEPYRAGRGTPIEMELLTEGSELAIAAPWRFDSPEVEFTVAGHLAPAGRHLTPADLLASATPKNIRWRLISGEKRGETPAIRRS
jgi:hypothetical protein